MDFTRFIKSDIIYGGTERAEKVYYASFFALIISRR